jgi:hypothetical protein
MEGARRKRREQAAELDTAAAEAMADVACRCGTYEGRAAHTIAHDNGRCAPPGAYGQLVQLKDGRWGQRWRHPEIA